MPKHEDIEGVDGWLPPSISIQLAGGAPSRRAMRLMRHWRGSAPTLTEAQFEASRKSQLLRWTRRMSETGCRFLPANST